jgi:hypothetical protein
MVIELESENVSVTFEAKLSYLDVDPDPRREARGACVDEGSGLVALISDIGQLGSEGVGREIKISGEEVIEVSDMLSQSSSEYAASRSKLRSLESWSEYDFARHHRIQGYVHAAHPQLH